MLNKCKNCNKDFKPKKQTKGLYCSCICYWQSRSFGEKPNCMDCNKKLSSHKCLRCHKCAMIAISGNKHHMWKQDRTKLAKKQERGDSAYREWRQLVWLRDNFTCKIANPDCNGRIEAHHILGWKDYPELRYQINNGITLCHAHHPRKRDDEAKLSPYFQELVAKMK